MATLRKVRRVARLAEDAVRRAVGLATPDAVLERDAEQFWTADVTADNGFWWHARESDFFDDARWDAMGQRHVKLVNDLWRQVGVGPRVASAVDWGCGGGANVKPLLGLADTVYGVDVSRQALQAAARQARQAQQALAPDRFVPVEVALREPERAAEQIGTVDLFACFYVFELLPSRAYGLRLLRLAASMLRPGGTAVIQIKYATIHRRTWARRWSYRRGVANMTTYPIDEFWNHCVDTGFEPCHVVVVPRPAEVPDERYAYFLLRKLV